MRLHALIPASRANGPGLHAVVFFQGCKLGCVGCWNPQTHPFHGTAATVDAVVQGVLRARQEHPLEGVTFSGGEPMQQADSLRRLIQGSRRQAPELRFGMFSGYAEHELTPGRYWIWGNGSSQQHRRRLWQETRACLDFAILGRFDEAQPSSQPLRTTRNQVLWLFSARYAPPNFSEELTEVSIKEGGRVEVTGFPTLGSPWQGPTWLG
ncbi:MAG: 4Fe-4S single cluster domain-containing protein [Terriglobia bacterium]|jgi:anaerobic ribonucleoside-triphosphate reductase activating protein